MSLIILFGWVLPVARPGVGMRSIESYKSLT